MWRPALGLVILGLVGCGESGPTRTEKEVQQAKTSLITALDSWKNNEPDAKLVNATPAIQFSDDFRKTKSLVEYEIGASSVPDPRSIAFTVTITTRDKKNKEESQTVTYLVDLDNPVRVSRDPYN